MCVSDTPGRSHKSVFAGALGETTTTGPSANSRAATLARESFTTRLLKGLVLGYRWLISPWIGPRCRFLPTCSEYALDALDQHGAIRGGWLTVRRLARCHPFGGSGFDPVPDSPEPAECRRSIRCHQPEPMFQKPGLNV